MPPRARPTYEPMKKVTSLQLLELLKGPCIDAYIGREMKHYAVPKALLCYFSPFFDKCLNGGFKEAGEGVFRAPEDRVEDFECLLDCLIRGTIDTGTVPAKQKIEKCFDFLNYTDYYKFGDISDVIIGPLRYAVIEAMNTPSTPPPVDDSREAVIARMRAAHRQGVRLHELPSDGLNIEPEIIECKHIELVFRTCSSGSPLRTFIAQAVMALSQSWRCNRLGDYLKLANEIEGFAVELVYVISKNPFASRFGEDWFEDIPLTKEEREKAKMKFTNKEFRMHGLFGSMGNSRC